ncbi:MAG TPA: ATP-binding protein [Candidatus Competibacter sp.]|nr:two-component sensor histidine kinase [Candidatus Competibacteraceae bacterium]HPE73485.1 ATP-binding protein [Candidatus Competibacter sp.]HRW64855.1 ATP-binding protein [Candidatus Competibacter sp.]
MKRSLRRHLSMALGGVIVLAGLVAALASFSLAYFEAKEFQDDMLWQIAMLDVSDTGKLPLPKLPRRDVESAPISDPESRIIVIYLPRDSMPAWIHLPRGAGSVWFAGELSPGFHTLSTSSGDLRVFVQDAETGERRVVAQLTEVRDEIAIDSGLRTLIPLLLLIPLLVGLIVRIVRSELMPITRLSRSLDEQPADRPRAISDADLPDEITPFVHAINRLLARVNLLIGQQRRFIADAAHELRSPLTALSLQTQNLLHAGSLEAMRERVIPLQDGIERARHLTEQLLSLARTQASAAETSVVDVSVMARELMAERLPLAEAKGIDLGLEETAPLFMRGSWEALWLVVSNALENALKYTPEGGAVTLRLLSDERSDVIEIVDNGPGIPISERERVFDAFYRMPGADGEGSGLGLAIVREVAIRLGGVLSLHERPDGTGLVFRYRQGGEK